MKKSLFSLLIPLAVIALAVFVVPESVEGQRTPPTITSVSPATASGGAVITVYGSGFDTTDRYYNAIKFGSTNNLNYAIAPSTDGRSLRFNVPYRTDGTYPIIVYVNQDSSWVSSNEYPFTIASSTPPSIPFIQVVSPNGGEKWALGSTIDVKWTASGAPTDAKLRINLLDDQGFVYSSLVNKYGNQCIFDDNDQVARIGTCIDINSGYYSLYLPKAYNTGKFRLELSCFTLTNSYCGVARDTSDGLFDIVASSTAPTASVKIISPNGGENFVLGNTYDINWNNSGLASYDLIRVQWVDSFGFSLGIADRLESTTNNLKWTLPNIPTGKYKISVCVLITPERGCSSTIDQSDNYFTIASSTQNTTSCYNFATNLQMGSKGKDVFALQNFLVSKKLFNLSSVTGYFGSLTFDALQSYQKSVGIEPTGYFGPETRAKVNSECVATQPSINITYPSAGESLTTNFQYKIIWTTTTIQPNTLFDITEFLDSGKDNVVEGLTPSQASCVFDNIKNKYICGTGWTPLVASSKAQLAVGKRGTNEIGYSGIFSIGSTTPNTSPKFVSFPTIPTSIKIGEQVNFSWTATDLDNDRISWSIDWGDGSTEMTGPCPVVLPPSPPIGGTTAGGGHTSVSAGTSTYTGKHAWMANGTFVAAVAVSDCRGGSKIYKFKVAVGLIQPPAPLIIDRPTSSATPIYVGTNPPHSATVTFGFTLNNVSNNDFYISKNSSLSLVTKVAGSATLNLPSSLIVVNPTTLAGDSSTSYIIPAGTFRQFLFTGILDNYNGTTGHYSAGIVQINYGATASNPTGLSIIEGLSGLVTPAIILDGSASIPQTQTTSEQVKCVFNGATTVQKCYTATSDSLLFSSCSGVSSCIADVKGIKGTPMTWKSSCGGYAYTVIDGNSEYANFKCTTSIIEPSLPPTKQLQTSVQSSSIWDAFRALFQ